MKININSTNFLKLDDISHKDIVTITSNGEWREGEYQGKPTKSFRINVKLQNGDEREATFDWETVKAIVHSFGDETETWIDKEVRAWKTASEKAKAGFKYVYRPTDWTRDDTGMWIQGETSYSPEEYPESEIQFDAL